jgi:hypothetical protein
VAVRPSHGSLDGSQKVEADNSLGDDLLCFDGGPRAEGYPSPNDAVVAHGDGEGLVEGQLDKGVVTDCCSDRKDELAEHAAVLGASRQVTTTVDDHVEICEVPIYMACLTRRPARMSGFGAAWAAGRVEGEVASGKRRAAGGGEGGEGATSWPVGGVGTAHGGC